MAGFTLIADWVAAGQEFGIFDFYLPFVIMFAIFWTLLTKTKLFGDPYPTDKKKKKQGRMTKGVNLIISLGASLYIMANTTMGVSFAAFLSALFGGTFMVILTIIAFVAVLYVIWNVSKGKDPFKDEGVEEAWTKWALLAVIAAVILALGVYTSTFGTAVFPGLTLPGLEIPSIPTIVFPSINLTSQDLAVFLLVGITGLIVFYVAFWPEGASSS